MSSTEWTPSTRPRKASDWVSRYLRDSIIAGKLKPGQQLPLVSLAAEVGMSTTPVREALGRLQDEGLVVGDAHRTFQVAALTLEDIRDYYRLHAFISGVLAERATHQLTPEGLAALRKLNTEIVRRASVGDFEGFHDLNFQFHKLLNETDSAVMKRFVTLTSRVITRRSFPHVAGWAHSIDDHAEIVEAVASHDAERARVLMEAHIHRVGLAVISDLEAEGWGQARTDISARTAE